MIRSPTTHRAKLLISLVVLVTACSSDADGATTDEEALSVVTTEQSPEDAPTSTVPATMPSTTVVEAASAATSAQTAPTAANSDAYPAGAFAATLLTPPIEADRTWTYDAPALSPVAVGDDWAAFSALVDGVRHHVVLDPRSGNVRWSRPASYSSILLGYEPRRPLVVDDILIHFDEYDDLDADVFTSLREVKVVGIDVRTGEERWTTDTPIAVTAPLHECENGRACGSGFLLHSPERRWLEIDVASGALSTSERNGELLSGDVVMDRSGTREEHRFVRRDGSTELWSVRFDDAFESDVDSRRGFSSHLDEDSSTWVAYVPAASGDFADDAVVGLDHDTGQQRWTFEGRSLNCWGRLSIDGNAWCRHTGRYTVKWNGDGSGRVTSYTDITTRLEVFDPTTGETVGGVELATEPAWNGEGEHPPLPDPAWYADGGVIVATPTGLVALDTESGETTPQPDNLLVWCPSPRVDSPRDQQTFFSGYHPCIVGDETRSPVDSGRLPGAWFDRAGTIVDETAITVTDNRVTGWTLSSSKDAE